MSRLGFTTEALVEAALPPAATAGIEVEGVMTHLASADEDARVTERQLDRFDEAVARAGRARAAAAARPRLQQRRPRLRAPDAHPRAARACSCTA